MMAAGMNPQVGGPVGGGGGIVMMNNGGMGTPSNTIAEDGMKTTLNTYIYAYLLKLGHYDLARSLYKHDKFEMHLNNNIKRSPGRKAGGDMNGDSMDMDGNDDIPDDLPVPTLPMDYPGNGFLFDWFCVFYDMFMASRQKGSENGNNIARQYISQTQNQQRQRENLQNAKLPGNGMMPNNPQQMAAMRNQMMRNNMMSGNMPGNMGGKMTPQAINMMNKLHAQQQQQQQQQQMQRDGSEMGINGQRPATPTDGDQTGSPSKRPRLDGQQPFNGGMVPNGRGQGIANQPNMMIQNSFTPAQINQAQFRQNGALQQKPMMQGGPGANGINMMGNTGSPMMGNIDPQFSMNGMEAMTYGRMPGQAGMPNGAAAQSGNHALQDYQMQLMLLEQQNKKRLMMARQEQDNISRGDGGAPIPGQVGMQQGMSPSGSRTGASPNPMDQMKRGTSQMGMGSPSGADLPGRGGSPIHFMQGQPPEINPGLFMNGKDGLVPGGQNMGQQRNMELNAMRAQQGRAMGQFPPGQQMPQNLSQGQPQPMGTPGLRNEMPPPSAPATGGSAQRGGQPSPPNSSVAPPTPSTANKPNPKGKKGKEGDNARKRPNKKNSTTNADAADPPATPTPSTPITPVHPASFNNSGSKGPNTAANAAPTSNPTSQPVQQMQPQDQVANGFDTFGTNNDQTFNLDFSALENPDVLENFDFDSFLNQNGTDNFGDDLGFGPDVSLNFDEVNNG